MPSSAFWRRYRRDMEAVCRPIFKTAFITGAAVAFRGQKASFDAEAISDAAEDYLNNYMGGFIGGLEETTREGLKRALDRARTEGLTPKQVTKLIEPLFGKARAERIAVTEITRMMGRGAVTQYRLVGWTHWEWRTAQDDHVDGECAARSGNEYPVTEQFDPAHPSCRCWPVPAGELNDTDN